MLRKVLFAGLGMVTLVALGLGSLLLLGPAERAAPLETPGYHVTSLDVAHRDVPLPLSIWYPTTSTETPELIGQNLLFYGFHAQRDAVPVDADLPVVVLIHGSGGNGPRLGWLAVRLANAGHIVVAANHPGTTSQDSWPEDTVRIWERPQDVAAMMDWLGQKSPLGLRPDMSRLGVLGFSIGGQSSLALAGIEVTKEAFLSYCSSYDDAVDCQWMEKGGLDLTTIDATRYNANHADPRPKAFVAVDPALPRAVNEASFDNVTRPLQLINLGAIEGLSSAVRVNEWPSFIEGAKYHAVPDSWHFSFLAECSRAGRLIIGIASPKTEEICTDPAPRLRSDVHDEVSSVILEFFDENL